MTPQVAKLVREMGSSEWLRAEIQGRLGLSDRKSFREPYLAPALEAGLVEFTIPEKPNSRLQGYRLTEKGKAYARRKVDGDPS